MRDDPYTLALQDRIKTLEGELLRRPTTDQLEYIVEYGRRQKALYEAVLARNVVLKTQVGRSDSEVMAYADSGPAARLSWLVAAHNAAGLYPHVRLNWSLATNQQSKGET